VPNDLLFLAQKPPPPPTPADYKRSATQDGQDAEAVIASLPDPNDPKQSRREARNETMIFREMSSQLSGGDFLHWLKKHWDTNLKRDKYRAAMERVKEAADAYVKSMKKGGFGSKKLLTDLDQAKEDAEKARKELQAAIFAEQEAAMGGLVECGAEAAEWCVSKNHDKCKELDCSEDECECTLYYAWFGGEWEPKEQEKIRHGQGSSKKAGGGGGGGGGQQGAQPPGVEPGPQPGPGRDSEKEPGDDPKEESRQYASGDKPPPPLKASPIVSPSGTTSTQGGGFAVATRAPDGVVLYASQPVGESSRSVATENPCLPYWTLAENILASVSARRGISSPKPTVSGGTMIVTVSGETMRSEFESLYQKDAARLGNPPRECVRVVAQIQAGDGPAPKDGSGTRQDEPPGTGSTEPESTTTPAHCLTCAEALAVANGLGVDDAIKCLLKAASLAGLTADIDPSTADRAWLLRELRARCGALVSSSRSIPRDGVFQDKPPEDPRQGTGTKPWDYQREDKPCKDDKYYYIMIIDDAPWDSRDPGEPPWSEREKRGYNEAVKEMQRALDSMVYPRHPNNPNDPVLAPKAGTKFWTGESKVFHVKAKREELKNGGARRQWTLEEGEKSAGDNAAAAIKAGATDPCMRGLFIFGHGDSGEMTVGERSVSPNVLLGKVESTVWGVYDHRLLFYFAGGCKASSAADLAGQKFERLTSVHWATDRTISTNGLRRAVDQFVKQWLD